MNKTEFVEKIITQLDKGNVALERRVTERLADARIAAARAAAQRQTALEAGGFGAWTAHLGGALGLPQRAGLAALALAAVTWGIVHWQQRPTQPESIDLALLVDEAPLSAYTRPDFEACINQSC